MAGTEGMGDPQYPYVGWSDLHNHYERLERDAKEYVDKLIECYVKGRRPIYRRRR